MATLGALGAASAALIVHRWAIGREPDLLVGAVLLAVAAWSAALAAAPARCRRRLVALTPYVVAGLGLVTLGVFQAVGDASDAAHTNALLGAYLALPVSYILFFLLRPPAEALVGALITCGAVVALQLTLPPILGDRHSTGPWIAAFTGFWHAVTILLLFALPQLRSDRDLLEAVMRSSRDAMVLLVPRRRPPSAGELPGAAVEAFEVAFANEAAAAVFGLEGGEDLATGGPLGAARELHERLAEAHDRRTEVTISATLPTLTGVRWFRVTAAPSRTGIAATLVDITELKETEVRAVALAETDALTGLLNRRGLEAQGPRLIAGAAPGSTALCYIDLDGFKAVNDAHGHEAGDRVLQVFSERLKAATRSSDLVARLGGDEFVVLAAGIPLGAVEPFFERVHAAATAPFAVAGALLELRASLGVVTRARDLGSALGKADAAMYRAKQRGGGVALACDDDRGQYAGSEYP